MGNSLLDYLESKNSKLVEKLTKNTEVTSALVGSAELMVNIATKRGLPWQGIRLRNVNRYKKWIDGKPSAVIMGHVSFVKLIMPSDNIWASAAGRPFYQFLMSANQKLADAFRMNSHLESFFNETLSFIDEFCQESYIPFPQLKIQEGVITPDDKLRIMVGRYVYDPYKKRLLGV